MRVACIGSRQISESEEKAFVTIGSYLAECGHTVVTGNALGSDQAFARGGNNCTPKRVELCLPWKSYEQQAWVAGNMVRVVGEETDSKYTKYYAIADLHHPAWKHLKSSVRRLMARNAMIVLEANMVIARLNWNKTGGGGTGHGWRIAESLDIKRYDVSNPETLKKMLKHIREVRKARAQ